MMNRFLYLVMLKREGKKILGCSASFISYEWLITWVYPIIIKSANIEKLPSCFPKAVKRVFGVAEGADLDLSYESYISAQFWGRLWSLVMSVYCNCAINAVIVQPSEQGYIVFPLSSPVSRSEIFCTQIAVLLTELVIVTGSAIVGVYAAAGRYTITISKWQYFRLGISAFSLFTTLSSYGLFMTMLVSPKEKALQISSSITIFFYGLDAVASLSDRYSKLRYFTPFGLYKPKEILQGLSLPLWGVVILSAVSLVSLFLAGLLYLQQDLAV